MKQTDTDKLNERRIYFTIKDEYGNEICSIPTPLCKSDLHLDRPLESEADLQRLADTVEKDMNGTLEILRGQVMDELNKSDKPARRHGKKKH